MSYKRTDLERVYKARGWHLVVRSSDHTYLDERADQMRLQGWKVHLVPYGRKVQALWTAPPEVMA